MHGAVAESFAIGLLALSLLAAVLRPRHLNEAFVSVPAAVLIVLTGVVPRPDAVDTLRQIGPTVGFLGAILVFGQLCADSGVFDYLGTVAARRSHGQAPRLLVLVVVIAALVTAVLTLDATVVLLTPVVLATTARLGITARPYLYACTRLANSGSLLLPVSNLTNLLAFSASGLSFGRFAALMVVPWVLAGSAEWLGLRTFFRLDLESAEPVDGGDDDHGTDAVPAPTYALVVLALTVAGFVLTSSVQVAPAWAAVAGCVALLGPRLGRRELSVRPLVGAANPGFCAFVLALAVIVDGVTRHGLRAGLSHLVPSGSSLLALLALAFLAAVLANLVNNLPATLALLPLVATNPSAVLAVLLGVNIGPNATYAGSLATLLWRRLLPMAERPRAGQFHRLGLVTVPVILVLTTVALWAGVHTIGV